MSETYCCLDDMASKQSCDAIFEGQPLVTLVSRKVEDLEISEDNRTKVLTSGTNKTKEYDTAYTSLRFN